MDFADRTQLSLDKLAVLESQLETIRDFILNCGAYTAVDKAESENELADIVNHKAVKLIAQYATDNHVKLIHISTDYVFDGTSSIALTEEAKRNLLMYMVVLKSRRVSLLRSKSDAIIIRTSWVYSRFGNNFVKRCLDCCKKETV
jgi:dTDP-4-dehydrorhamnose reductase